MGEPEKKEKESQRKQVPERQSERVDRDSQRDGQTNTEQTKTVTEMEKEMDRQTLNKDSHTEQESERDALTPVGHAMVSSHDIGCLPITAIELVNQLHHLLYPSIHHSDVHQILPEAKSGQ